MANKTASALDRFLEKHKPTCTFWIFSGDRHCSCGRDAALLELEDLRSRVPAPEESRPGGWEQLKGKKVYFRKIGAEYDKQKNDEQRLPPPAG